MPAFWPLERPGFEILEGSGLLLLELFGGEIPEVPDVAEVEVVGLVVGFEEILS
jgi:hypothetical protein